MIQPEVQKLPDFRSAMEWRAPSSFLRSPLQMKVTVEQSSIFPNKMDVSIPLRQSHSPSYQAVRQDSAPIPPWVVGGIAAFAAAGPAAYFGGEYIENNTRFKRMGRGMKKVGQVGVFIDEAAILAACGGMAVNQEPIPTIIPTEIITSASAEIRSSFQGAYPEYAKREDINVFRLNANGKQYDYAMFDLYPGENKPNTLFPINGTDTVVIQSSGVFAKDPSSGNWERLLGIVIPDDAGSTVAWYRFTGMYPSDSFSVTKFGNEVFEYHVPNSENILKFWPIDNPKELIQLSPQNLPDGAKKTISEVKLASPAVKPEATASPAATSTPEATATAAPTATKAEPKEGDKQGDYVYRIPGGNKELANYYGPLATNIPMLDWAGSGLPMLTYDNKTIILDNDGKPAREAAKPNLMSVNVVVAMDVDKNGIQAITHTPRATLVSSTFDDLITSALGERYGGRTGYRPDINTQRVVLAKINKGDLSFDVVVGSEKYVWSIGPNSGATIYVVDYEKMVPTEENGFWEIKNPQTGHTFRVGFLGTNSRGLIGAFSSQAPLSELSDTELRMLPLWHIAVATDVKNKDNVKGADFNDSLFQQLVQYSNKSPYPQLNIVK